MVVIVHYFANGVQRPASFEFNEHLTVDFVENTMRNSTGIAKGLLSAKADLISPVVSLIDGDEYYFILLEMTDTTDGGRYKRNMIERVFILGLGPDVSETVVASGLLGTCFAVTRTHVLTAHRNLCKGDGVTLAYDSNSFALGGKFLICSRAANTDEVEVLKAPLEVKVVDKDEEYGWALLELVDATCSFPAWLELCEQNNREHRAVKTYYAPISRFRRDGYCTFHIWPEKYRPVLRYINDEVDRTIVIVEGGLNSGSCGSPCINGNGKVVAMHLRSFMDVDVSQDRSVMKDRYRLSGITAEDLDVFLGEPGTNVDALAVSMTAAMDETIGYVPDHAYSGTSTRVGVVLASVPRLCGVVLAILASYPQ